MLFILVVVLLILLQIGWRFGRRYRNHSRAIQAVRALEQALLRKGHVAGMHWIDATRLQVDLRLPDSGFRRMFARIDFVRMPYPWLWLRARWSKRRDQVTLAGDLDRTPQLAIQLDHHLWYGRSRRSLPTDPELWDFDAAEPVVFTTRTDWLQNATLAVIATRQLRSDGCDRVILQSESPQLQARLTLDRLLASDPRELIRSLQTVARETITSD